MSDPSPEFLPLLDFHGAGDRKAFITDPLDLLEVERLVELELLDLINRLLHFIF